MILKSLGHKTRSFGKLLAYVQRGAETEANPFIGVFHLTGRALVDAKLPISADEGLLMVQRRLAQSIAARVASLTHSDSATE